jgi:hypothetical protein
VLALMARLPRIISFTHGGNANIFCQPTLAEAQQFEKFCEKNFSGMKRGEFVLSHKYAFRLFLLLTNLLFLRHPFH